MTNPLSPQSSSSEEFSSEVSITDVLFITDVGKPSYWYSNTFPLYPRDVLYRNNANINKVFLFSYSGTTNDIIKSTENFEKQNVYLITKGEFQKIVLKTGLLKKNILSYRTTSNKGKERGFLSFEGAVAPAVIFFK